MTAQAILSDMAVPAWFPLWDMHRVGRKSAANTPMQRARLNAGLRQADLAERLGVEPATIQRWETGARVPNAEALVKLADELETTVDELLGRAPIAERPKPARTPTPSEAQLVEVLRYLASKMMPGPIDAEKLRAAAEALSDFLEQFADDPGQFDEPGRSGLVAETIVRQSERRRA